MSNWILPSKMFNLAHSLPHHNSGWLAQLDTTLTGYHSNNKNHSVVVDTGTFRACCLYYGIDFFELLLKRLPCPIKELIFFYAGVYQTNNPYLVSHTLTNYLSFAYYTGEIYTYISVKQRYNNRKLFDENGKEKNRIFDYSLCSKLLDKIEDVKNRQCYCLEDIIYDVVREDVKDLHNKHKFNVIYSYVKDIPRFLFSEKTVNEKEAEVEVVNQVSPERPVLENADNIILNNEPSTLLETNKINIFITNLSTTSIDL